MLTAERRGVSSRRGMTVLGKIPGVPKPINLPSQRLENRGLDPNVEIVPRGGVTWGASSRSPPVGGNAWGLGSSPPVGGAGGWSAPPSQAQTHAHPTPSATGSGAWPSSSNTTTAPIVSRPGARPASNDSDAWPAPSESLRPLSAGSASSQQHLGPGHSSWSGPGGSRALSSNNQLHVQHQGPSQRPRSAEVHPSTASNTEPLLSELDSSSTSFHSGGPMPAWGGAGANQKRQEESSQQGSRFLLKNNEFPTLGADKDMDNQQQQHTMGGGSHHTTEERPPRSPAYFDVHPTSPGHEGGPMDNRPSGPDNWRRDAGSFAGPHDNWRRDGSHPHGHMGPPPDSWRRDAGQHGPQADNWRRDALGPNSFGHGGAPPGGGRYPMPPPEGFGPMPRFAAPLGMFNGPPMGPGPRGFLPADGYGPQGPFPRPGPGLHAPMVYGNVAEREMAMMGGGGRQGHYGVPGRGPPFPGQFGLPGKGPPQFPHFGNVQPMESYGKWGRYNGRPEGPRSSNLPLGGPPHPMGHSGPPRDHAFADPRGDLLGFDLDDARPSSGSQLRELPRDGRRDDGNAESSHPVGPVAGESHTGDALEFPLRNGDSRDMSSSEGQARDGGEMHGGSDARRPFHSSGSPPNSVAPHNNSGSSGIGNPFDHGPGHEEWAMVADEAMDFSKPAFPSDLPPPNTAVSSGPQLSGGPIGVQGHTHQQGQKAGRPVAMQQGGGQAQNWRGAQVKPVPPKRSTSPDWKQKKAVREVQSAGTASDAAKSFRGPQTVQAGGPILDQDGHQQQQVGKAVRILKRHGDPEGTPRESSEAASFEATSKEASSAVVTSSPVSVATGPEDLRINDATVSDGQGNGGGPHAAAQASAGPQSAPQATGSVLTALSVAGKGEGSLASAKQPSPASVVKPGVGSVSGNGDQPVVHEAFAPKTGNHEAKREATREDMEQRLHQRQEDEEKRDKEQKARAQAMLDDLNRRTGSQQTDAGSGKRVAEKGKEVSTAAALGVTSPDLPGIKAGAGNVEGIIGQDVNRSNRDGGRRGERRNGRVHKEKGEGGRGRGGAAAPSGPNGNGPAATSGPGPTPASLPAPAAASLPAPAANSEPLLPSPSPAALLPSPQVQSQRGGGSQLSAAQGQAKNSPRHRRKPAKQGDAGNQESSAGTVAVANLVEGKDWLQPAAAAAGGVAVPQSGAQGNQSAAESGVRKRRDGRSRDGRSRARRGEGKVDGDGSQTELVKSGGAKSEDGATGSSRGAQRRGGSGRREGRDRLPQDVRITEKSGTGGGAEAVHMGASNQSGRSRGGGRGSGFAGQSASGQEKHAVDIAAGSSSDPNRGRRADMERYHPKPLAQKIEQQQLHGQDGHSHPVAEQAVGSRPEARANGTERQGVDPIVKSGGLGAGTQRQRPKQEGPASGAAIVEPAKADPRPGPRAVPSGEPQRPGAGPQRPGGSQGNVSSLLAAAILGQLPAGHGTNPPPQQTPGSRVGAQVGVFVTPPMVRVGNGPQVRVPPPAGHVAGDGGARNMQGQGVPKTPTGGKTGGHTPAVKGINSADSSTVKVMDGGVQQHQHQQPLQPVKAPQQQSVQTVVGPPQGGALSKAEGATGQGNIVRGTHYGVGVRVRNVPSNVQNGTGSRHSQAGGGRGSGRPGQSTSGRGADAENRRDGSVKPRLVINATNGLMPGQASVT